MEQNAGKKLPAGGARISTVPPTYVPLRGGALVALDMDYGASIYNYEFDLVHRLSPTAAITWHVCDGEATVEQLSAEIADAFGAEPGAVLHDVCALVAELDALGIVVDAGRTR